MKRFEQSNGRDTAIYKNYLLLDINYHAINWLKNINKLDIGDNNCIKNNSRPTYSWSRYSDIV